MPRTVTIPDPRSGRKPAMGETPIQQGPPKPVRGKVYIILNTQAAAPGAHVAGAFSEPAVAVDIVQSLSGVKDYQLGAAPAQSGDSLWEVVVSEVICPD